MSRNLDSTTANILKNNVVYPCFLAKLLWATEQVYVWTGVGTLLWNDHNYLGVGVFGSISTVGETNTVEAQGISITLSGIPTDLFTTNMTDLSSGGTASIYLGFFNNTAGGLIGTPIPVYMGLLDQPSIEVAGDKVSITIAVENRLTDLNRSRGGRYTDADQRSRYPNDGSFRWVQYLQDTNINWHG
jgi:hypothetical protein